MLHLIHNNLKHWQYILKTKSSLYATFEGWKNSKRKKTIQDRRMYNLEDWLTESN